MKEYCKTICRNIALTCKILQDVFQDIFKNYIFSNLGLSAAECNQKSARFCSASLRHRRMVLVLLCVLTGFAAILDSLPFIFLRRRLQRLRFGHQATRCLWFFIYSQFFSSRSNYRYISFSPCIADISIADCPIPEFGCSNSPNWLTIALFDAENVSCICDWYLSFVAFSTALLSCLRLLMSFERFNIK